MGGWAAVDLEGHTDSLLAVDFSHDGRLLYSVAMDGNGENGERNQRLVVALQELAAEKGVRPAQLAIAWVLARGETIVPVIGARKRTQLEESLGALKVELSPADLARIEETVPADAVAGTRYGEEQMRMLDSER